MIKVLFVNNDGGGFADYVELPYGTTAVDMFTMRMGQGNNPGAYIISVNRMPAAADQVLQNGDRVTITPTKIEAGRVR